MQTTEIHLKTRDNNYATYQRNKKLLEFFSKEPENKIENVIG